MAFQKAVENVFAVVGLPAHANVSAFILPSQVVLVDCGIQLPAAEPVRREIEALSGLTVETVILTHFHSDHTRALPAFADCRIIASNVLVRNLRQAGRMTPAGFDSTLPNETFDRQLELRDGAVRLVVKQTGGHTDCSTYVFCPNYRTVAAGDNLWTQYYPWGGARGGDPDMWVRALEEYLSLDATCFIPGHGPVGNRDSVVTLLGYVKNVGDVMRELIAREKSEGEVIRAGRAVQFPPSGTGSAHPSTLKKWYTIWRARVK